eukprot:gene3884-6374_t
MEKEHGHNADQLLSEHPLLPLLTEFHRLATTTNAISEDLDKLLDKTAPGSDIETVKNEAFTALQQWKDRLRGLIPKDATEETTSEAVT